jgi:DNA-binding phage protein
MENIGKELKKIIKKEKVSIYKMAEDLGFANESLYRSLKNGANPEWKRIKQILNYLGYDLKFIKRKNVKPKSELPKKERSK